MPFLSFPTEEEAERYGANLMMRWTAVVSYEAHPSIDEVNCKYPT